LTSKLADFAQAEFALEAKEKDGHTLREHLTAAWRSSGVKPPELSNPVPQLISYLWDYYLELHKRRGNNGYGHVALTFLEIEAWERKTQRKLDAWELKAILAVDDAYMVSLAKKSPEGS